MPLAQTFDALRAGVVTSIASITPTYEPRSAARWNEVLSEDDVPSHDLRNFFVELSTPEPTGEVYGGCLEHTTTLRLHASYGGLNKAEEQVIPARDNQDLWRALSRLEGVAISKQGFEPEAEDGRLWGAHVFEVEFFLPS